MSRCWSRGVTLDVTQLRLKYRKSLYILWQLELHKKDISKSYIKTHCPDGLSTGDKLRSSHKLWKAFPHNLSHKRTIPTQGNEVFLFHLEKYICPNPISFSRSFFLIKVEQLSPALQWLPDELRKRCSQSFCFPASLHAGDTTLGLCHCKMLHGNIAITAYHSRLSTAKKCTAEEEVKLTLCAPEVFLRQKYCCRAVTLTCWISNSEASAPLAVQAAVARSLAAFLPMHFGGCQLRSTAQACQPAGMVNILVKSDSQMLHTLMW